MIIHLKVDSSLYGRIRNESVNFLILPADVDPQAGDKLMLKEISIGEDRLTGRETESEATYKMESHDGLKDGFCAIGFKSLNHFG